MTSFGDYEELDARGTEPADPEQVACRLRRLLDSGLSDVEVARRLLAWLRRQGSA